MREVSSKKLENFVLTELMKFGLKPNRDLFYGKTKKGFGVDFIVKKDQRLTMAIQACFDMTNIGTRDLEPYRNNRSQGTKNTCNASERFFEIVLKYNRKRL